MARSHLDKEKALQLWFNGLLDKEIGKELGCSANTIWEWRYKNDLPSNRGIFSWDKGYREVVERVCNG